MTAVLASLADVLTPDLTEYDKPIFTHILARAWRFDSNGQNSKWRTRGKGSITIYYNMKLNKASLMFFDEKYKKIRLLQYIENISDATASISSTDPSSESVEWIGNDYTMDPLNPLQSQWKLKFMDCKESALTFMILYNYHIVLFNKYLHKNEFLEEQICYICYELIHEAKLLGCGHIGCNLCITEWIASSTKSDHGATCPKCRSLISTSPISCLTMDHIIKYQSPPVNTICICFETYNINDTYICCDYCDNWYHPHCVGLKHTELNNITKYKCPLCISKETVCNDEILMAEVPIKAIYRWDEDVLGKPCWKKRVIDTKLQFLQNTNTGKHRLIARDHETNKLKLDQFIYDYYRDTLQMKSAKSISWIAMDSVLQKEYNKHERVSFAAKFYTEKDALDFKLYYTSFDNEEQSVISQLSRLTEIKPIQQMNEGERKMQELFMDEYHAKEWKKESVRALNINHIERSIHETVENTKLWIDNVLSQSEDISIQSFVFSEVDLESAMKSIDGDYYLYHIISYLMSYCHAICDRMELNVFDLYLLQCLYSVFISNDSLITDGMIHSQKVQSQLESIGIKHNIEWSKYIRNHQIKDCCIEWIQIIVKKIKMDLLITIYNMKQWRMNAHKTNNIHNGNTIRLLSGHIGKVVLIQDIDNTECTDCDVHRLCVFGKTTFIGIILNEWHYYGHDGNYGCHQWFESPKGKGLLVPLVFVEHIVNTMSSEIPPLKNQINKIELGDRVRTSTGKFGYVKYIGKVANHSVVMYGLELDNMLFPGNDGSFNGVQYFTAASGRGYFTIKGDIDKVRDDNDHILGGNCVIVTNLSPVTGYQDLMQWLQTEKLESVKTVDVYKRNGLTEGIVQFGDDVDFKYILSNLNGEKLGDKYVGVFDTKECRDAMMCLNCSKKGHMIKDCPDSIELSETTEWSQRTEEKSMIIGKHRRGITIYEPQIPFELQLEEETSLTINNDGDEKDISVEMEMTRSKHMPLVAQNSLLDALELGSTNEESEREVPVPHSSEIKVYNLPKDFDHIKLERMFAEVGDIKRFDRRDNILFVEYINELSAMESVRKYNGMQIDACNISVQLKTCREYLDPPSIASITPSTSVLHFPNAQSLHTNSASNINTHQVEVSEEAPLSITSQGRLLSNGDSNSNIETDDGKDETYSNFVKRMTKDALRTDTELSSVFVINESESEGTIQPPPADLDISKRWIDDKGCKLYIRNIPYHMTEGNIMKQIQLLSKKDIKHIQSTTFCCIVTYNTSQDAIDAKNNLQNIELYGNMLCVEESVRCTECKQEWEWDGNQSFVCRNCNKDIESEEKTKYSINDTERYLNCINVDKLYRFVNDEWVIRTQETKIEFYQHKENGKIRITARDPICFKLKLNHWIPPLTECRLRRKANTRQCWQWNAFDATVMKEEMDHNTYSIPSDTQYIFCAKFKSDNDCDKFYETFVNINIDDDEKANINDNTQIEAKEISMDDEKTTTVSEGREWEILTRMELNALHQNSEPTENIIIPINGQIVVTTHPIGYGITINTHSNTSIANIKCVLGKKLGIDLYYSSMINQYKEALDDNYIITDFNIENNMVLNIKMAHLKYGDEKDDSITSEWIITTVVGGVKLCIELTGYSVYDLKKKVFSVCNVPIPKQELFLENQMLIDDQLLCDLESRSKEIKLLFIAEIDEMPLFIQYNNEYIFLCLNFKDPLSVIPIILNICSADLVLLFGDLVLDPTKCIKEYENILSAESVINVSHNSVINIKIHCMCICNGFIQIKMRKSQSIKQLKHLILKCCKYDDDDIDLDTMQLFNAIHQDIANHYGNIYRLCANYQPIKDDESLYDNKLLFCTIKIEKKIKIVFHKRIKTFIINSFHLYLSELYQFVSNITKIRFNDIMLYSPYLHKHIEPKWSGERLIRDHLYTPFIVLYFMNIPGVNDSI